MRRSLTLDDYKTNCAYRIDLVVDGLIVVEVKCGEKLAPIHRAQMPPQSGYALRSRLCVLCALCRERLLQ